MAGLRRRLTALAVRLATLVVVVAVSVVGTATTTLGVSASVALADGPVRTAFPVQGIGDGTGDSSAAVRAVTGPHDESTVSVSAGRTGAPDWTAFAYDTPAVSHVGASGPAIADSPLTQTTAGGGGVVSLAVAAADAATTPPVLTEPPWV